jgi:hypothetical protein
MKVTIFLVHFFTYVVHEREYTREAKKKEGGKIERKPATEEMTWF